MATRRAGSLQIRWLDHSSPSEASSLAAESLAQARPPSQALKSPIFIGQFLLRLRLAAETFAEWASLQQLPSGRLHIGALAFEKVVARPPEAGIRNEMRRIRGVGQVAARELVLALGAGLDAGEPVSDRIFDRLVVADLEMQARM